MSSYAELWERLSSDFFAACGVADVSLSSYSLSQTAEQMHPGEVLGGYHLVLGSS